MSTTMAYPSLPASPTLTNPDMILPYGEYDSTPSPPHRPIRPPTLDWKDPVEMDFSIGPPGHMQIGLGQMTPTTPIIYGNGTMLSDIGEVTEAESTPGRKPRSISSRLQRGQSPIRSSPTVGYQAVMRRSKTVSHQRAVSVESSSTITTEGQTAELFEDFDDGVSVDDSNFQGDDEESVAEESYDQRLAEAQAKALMRKDSQLFGTEEAQSSAALSRRAELILANAKKRLDNMEGNLTRARSSLYITPSSSMSSIRESVASTPSPPFERRIVPQLGAPPPKHRQVQQASTIPSGSPGHSRVYSENSLPLASQSTPHLPRSASAGSGQILGNAIKTTTILRDRKDSTDYSPPNYSAPLNRSPNPYVTPLEPLSEDEPSPPLNYEFRPSTTEPYLTNDHDHRELTRSASSMQMRDLTDKMKDLKGKISTLRDKAREDNMKRRSLQSLRTPSPFTVAENWFQIPKSYKESGLRIDTGFVPSPWEGQAVVKESHAEEPDNLVNQESQEVEQEQNQSADLQVEDQGQLDEGVAFGTEEDILEVDEPQEEGYETATEKDVELEDPAYQDDENEAQPENGTEEDEYVEEFVDHDELDDYESEGDASTYHDTLTTPISHEDREDAFDYEHFFLHSAMGTLSQQRMGRRGSVDSFSSDDSAATERGPTASAPLVNEQNGHAKGHVRNQKSVDSISSHATFATATEGVGSDESQHEAEDDDEGASTPRTATRYIYKFSASKNGRSDRSKSMTDITARPISIIRNAESHTSHRPSLASFTSVGTQRSFPLINRPKTAASIPSSSTLNLSLSTPNDAPITNGNDDSPGREEGKESPVAMLIKDDQILVERLVASVGKCVLGLQDASRGSQEGRMYRRRLELARRILEGEETAEQA